MTTLFVVLAGLFVRIILPLLVMIGLVGLLRHLDARWQAEAILQQKQLAEAGPREHALDLRDCAIESVASKLSVQSTEPCWQVFRQANGYLHEECLKCEVFRASPILLPNN